jgi:hypothetical protein
VEDVGGLPYEEKIVIRGVLKPGKPVQYEDAIQISRTLPPLEAFTAEKAVLRDAEAVITSDGNQYILDFHPTAVSGGYYENNELIIEAGKTYTLTVKWRGKTAFATTYVPEEPVYQELKLDYEKRKYYPNNVPTVFDYPIVKTLITPRPNECYSITANLVEKRDTISGGTNIGQFEEVCRSEETNSAGFVPVRTDVPASTYGRSGGEPLLRQGDSVFVQVFAFDKAFYDYFLTRGNNNNDGFFSNPSNVQWNVKGDGIGMFIGLTGTKEIYVPH